MEYVLVFCLDTNVSRDLGRRLCHHRVGPPALGQVEHGNSFRQGPLRGDGV
jgi:hypothetical protein